MSKRLYRSYLALATTAALLTGGYVLLTAQTRSLLTMNDLNWKGYYSFPDGGDPNPGAPGTTGYSTGAVAVRYVNGKRRFMVPTFMRQDALGRQFGDLVEYQEPAASTSTGANPLSAPLLVETRRWSNWTMFDTTTAWQDANAVRVGGLYWDEAHHVIWYQLYKFYSSTNQPIFAATQLLDTQTTGDYAAVGTKYGPWWYRSTTPTDLFWKGVDWWLLPVPADAQSDFGGRKFIIGGAVGSIGGSGNIGPGFHAISNLPPLTDPPNTIIPDGLHLADYSLASPQSPPGAHRDTNYRFRPEPPEVAGGLPLDSNGTGLWNPSGSTGFWQMELDQVNSFCWVETPTKEGIIMFGRIAHGDTWYGWNPRWSTPGDLLDPPNSTDPTRAVENENGYGATQYAGAVYLFDPTQVRQVARGQRSPYSDGINPILIGDWHTTWPNMPVNHDNLGSTGISKPISQSQTGNSCFWDTQANQLIWVNPSSTDDATARPTISYFTIGNGPAPPANLRIVR